MEPAPLKNGEEPKIQKSRATNDLKKNMEKTKLLNLLAFLATATGAIFKIMHWPGASICLIVGSLLLVIALILGLAKNKESGASDMVNYLFTGASVFMVVGSVFMAQHWGGGRVFGMTGHILMFIMPLILLFQKDDSKMSNSFWSSYLVFVFMMVTLMMSRAHHQHHEGETPQEHTEEVQSE